MTSTVLSVNLGCPEPNPHKNTGQTGINKIPTTDVVEVRAPGPKGSGLGSGLVGDAVLDSKHHGGDDQAVYVFAREELDHWQQHLGRDLRNGQFGENLTTSGLEVDDAVLGELWQIGDVGRGPLLQVRCPRIPCDTFRGFMGIRGWLKTFTAHGRPGAYLKVVNPGRMAAGDSITVVNRPEHGVTISESFRALTLQRDLLPGLLRAGDDLTDELRWRAERQEGF